MVECVYTIYIYIHIYIYIYIHIYIYTYTGTESGSQSSGDMVVLLDIYKICRLCVCVGVYDIYMNIFI